MSLDDVLIPRDESLGRGRQMFPFAIDHADPVIMAAFDLFGDGGLIIGKEFIAGSIGIKINAFAHGYDIDDRKLIFDMFDLGLGQAVILQIFRNDVFGDRIGGVAAAGEDPIIVEDIFDRDGFLFGKRMFFRHQQHYFPFGKFDKV